MAAGTGRLGSRAKTSLVSNFSTAIVLDRNSQIHFHKPMIKTTDRKISRALFLARCVAHQQF